jgi:hypothetical protein
VRTGLGLALLALSIGMYAWSVHRWAPGRYVTDDPPAPWLWVVLWIATALLSVHVLSEALGSWWLSALLSIAVIGFGGEGVRRLHNRGLTPEAAGPEPSS